ARCAGQVAPETLGQKWDSLRDLFQRLAAPPLPRSCARVAPCPASDPVLSPTNAIGAWRKNFRRINIDAANTPTSTYCRHIWQVTGAQRSSARRSCVTVHSVTSLPMGFRSVLTTDSPLLNARFGPS